MGTGASVSSSGAGRRVVRALGLVFVLMLTAAAAAMLVFKDDLGTLWMAAVNGEPQSPVAPAAGKGSAAAPTSPGPAPAGSTPAAPATPAPAATPLAADAPAGAASPAATAETATAETTTSIAELMAAARAARGEGQGEGEAIAPADGTDPVATPAADPALHAQAPAPSSTPAAPMPVEQAVARLGRATEADTMRPQVTVSRDGSRGGLPDDTVAVAVPSLAIRDGVAEGYSMLLRGDFNAALGLYDKVLSDDPANLQALIGRAASLHKLRRLEEARAAYERVLGADPGNREALTNLLAIVAADEPQEAVARLRDLARQAPGFSPVIGQLGLLYGRMGATDAAIEELTRAVSLDPGNLLYRYNLAVLLDRAGRRAEAIPAYRLVLEGLRVSPAALAVSPDTLRARLQFLMSTG